MATSTETEMATSTETEMATSTPADSEQARRRRMMFRA